MNSLEHRIPPPIVVLVIGATMWAAARYTPHVLVADQLRVTLTVGVSLLGLLFGGSGFIAFRRAKTTIDPLNIEAAAVLVTNGIYRISRNPMYVGLTALLTAWAIYLASPFTLIGVVVFVLFTWRFQILPEERVMREKFGRSYDDYQRRVRRWL